jgi:hypothetical protein
VVNDNSFPRSLVGGGDCFEHYHSTDRVPTHYTLKQLQTLVKVKKISANYAVDPTDDIILVDTTSGVITATLPTANNGNEITVIRIAGANNVVVARSGTDTINGATSVTISTSYTPKTYKAMPPSIVTGYVSIV